MSEEDTKSRSSTSSELSTGKKLTINTKASEFDKFFKLVAQQFSAEKGYEEVGHALSTGTQLAHPPFNIQEFNESYPIDHNPDIETFYGYNEEQWSDFRFATLKEVQSGKSRAMHGSEPTTTSYYVSMTVFHGNERERRI